MEDDNRRSALCKNEEPGDRGEAGICAELSTFLVSFIAGIFTGLEVSGVSCAGLGALFGAAEETGLDWFEEENFELRFDIHEPLRPRGEGRGLESLVALEGVATDGLEGSEGW